MKDKMTTKTFRIEDNLWADFINAAKLNKKPLRQF